jgi:predicted metal-binding protein
MKHSRRALIKTSILSCLSVIALKSIPKSVASNDEIIAIFDNYRNALLNTDADLAYNSIDSNTKKYYQDILKTVLEGKAEQVKQMSFLDKVFIIRSRHH